MPLPRPDARQLPHWLTTILRRHLNYCVRCDRVLRKGGSRVSGRQVARASHQESKGMVSMAINDSRAIDRVRFINKLSHSLNKGALAGQAFLKLTSLLPKHIFPDSSNEKQVLGNMFNTPPGGATATLPAKAFSPFGVPCPEGATGTLCPRGRWAGILFLLQSAVKKKKIPHLPFRRRMHLSTKSSPRRRA